MPSYKEYLALNQELQPFAPETAAGTMTEPDTTIRLLGIILSATDDEVVFSHLGHRFYIRTVDISEVRDSDAAIPNPYSTGKPVELHVLAGARFVPFGAVTARSLNSGVPFAISRPSQIPDIDYPYHTANELAWLAQKGIAAADQRPTSTNSGTYCGHNTQSPKWSGTNSNDKQDDGKSDEYYGDDATHDDSGGDD